MTSTGFTRADRVAGLIQKTLSEVLQKRVSDPRLEMTLITGVKMSPDLKLARIYFITPGGDRRSSQAKEGFKSAVGYVKRTLARKLKLRYMPDLRFYYDESFDYGSRIDLLLSSLNKHYETDYPKTKQ